jgi:hypothetical protein
MGGGIPSRRRCNQLPSMYPRRKARGAGPTKVSGGRDKPRDPRTWAKRTAIRVKYARRLSGP